LHGFVVTQRVSLLHGMVIGHATQLDKLKQTCSPTNTVGRLAAGPVPHVAVLPHWPPQSWTPCWHRHLTCPAGLRMDHSVTHMNTKTPSESTPPRRSAPLTAPARCQRINAHDALRYEPCPGALAPVARYSLPSLAGGCLQTQPSRRTPRPDGLRTLMNCWAPVGWVLVPAGAHSGVEQASPGQLSGCASQR
jgi:hypothetical protein